MKYIRKILFFIILLFAIISLLFNSCTNKSNSTSTLEHIGSKTIKNNTNNRLKFNSGIQSIFEDSKGNLWFGSKNEGVALYKESSFTYFDTEDGLNHNQVYNFQEDKDGIIWIETGDGICYYDGKSITSAVNKNYSAKSSWAKAPNDLWFKGDKGYGYTDVENRPGVYRNHNGEITYLTFPIEQVKDFKSLYSNSINGVVKGLKGRLWFGTYEAVIGYDGQSFIIIDREKMGRTSDPRNIGIRALHEDSKGNLWIGDNGGGVFFFNGNKIFNFTSFHNLDKNNFKGNSLNHIVSIGEDKLGHIWFGTYGSGVWRFDGKSLTNYTAEDGINSNSIKAIYTTNDGTILFGGKDSCVVYKFNGELFDRFFE